MKKSSATTFEGAYGEIMAEYSKSAKEIEEASQILENYDESDFTAKQWERMLKLRMRMQN